MQNLIPRKRMETVAANGESSFAPISRLRGDWDRLFDRFLDDVWSPAAAPAGGTPLEIHESDDAIRVVVEVPGVDPSAIDVNLSGDVLTIAGDKVDPMVGGKGERRYSERRFGAFQRAVQLHCPVEPDTVDASHAHGVLTVTLRKAEAVRPRRIRIKGA